MSIWKDKVALVTGGSFGLGKAIAEAFAHEGAKLVLAVRGQEALEATASPLRQQGHEVATFTADLTVDREVEQLLAQTQEQFGRLDVLVNNAGRSSRGAVLETSPEDFQALWDLNFLGAVRCTRAAAGMLLESQGHVVNIGSLAAKTAPRYLGAYPASKFPLAAYSQQLRLELSPQGLHVLLVCPGPIAREDGGPRYAEQAANLPKAAQRPGGGARIKTIDPDWLAQRIVWACQRRQTELVVPSKARWLFALAQLSPTLGDWLLKKMT